MAEIKVDVQDGVMTLTFNRTERKNAITVAMYDTLAQALEQAKSDAAVRVVLLRGDERMFSSGNDLGDFLHKPAMGEDAPVLRFLRGIASCPKPVLAAVCGPAVGIGVTMLLHCDLVYAGDNAVFSMPFVNLGLCPEGASSLLMPQILGYQRAAAALLLGESFDAAVAQQVGLVNKILPPAEVIAYTLEVARTLVAKPQRSLLETKRLMKQSQQSVVQQVLMQEATIFGRMLREPAAKEAFMAFMEKRAPNFSNL